MFIQTETTPNPASLKFLPNRPVLSEDHGTGMVRRRPLPMSTAVARARARESLLRAPTAARTREHTRRARSLPIPFRTRAQYFQKADADHHKSPLAKRLFRIDGVTGVFLGKDFITVTKSKGMVWQSLKPDVFSTIMDFYAEGLEAVRAGADVGASDTTIHDDDDEVVAMVKELLETRIRPAVQEDGGDIFYVRFDEDTGIVWLRLAGSCSGCPSSSVTLKNGVENMLMHYIPEVTGVQAVEEEDEPLDTFEKKLAAAGIPSD